MPQIKAAIRLTVYKLEKTKWQTEANKHKLCLSQFVRMVLNSRLHIPSRDLAKKLEKKHVDQMSLLETINWDDARNDSVQLSPN